MGETLTQPLTLKQQRFVDEYLIDGNATQAAIRAGYSEKAAAEIAYENLRKPQISLAIEQAFKALQAKSGVTPEQVVKELARIAFADMGEFATWEPNGLRLRDSGELTPDVLAAVAEVGETVGEKTNTLRFKLHDKVKALALLGKHLGMFADRVEHSGRVEHAHAHVLAAASEEDLRALIQAAVADSPALPAAVDGQPAEEGDH